MTHPVKCLICGETFFEKLGRSKTAKYCSRECCSKSKLGKPTWNKGKPYTAILGEKNPKWIKDRSLVKCQEERNNPLYKQWRRSVLERDGFECQKCLFKGYPLQIHHIQRYRDFPELRYDISNGITLCIPCHLEETNRERKEDALKATC